MNTKSEEKQGKRRREGDDGGERKRLPPKPTGELYYDISSSFVVVFSLILMYCNS